MIYEQHLELAARVAAKSQFGRVRIGAVVARRGRVISVGFNQAKTHPLTIQFDYKPNVGIHAELDAVLGIEKEKLRGSTLYVVRIKMDGSWGLARPCKGCQGLIQHLELGEVVWSTGKEREYGTDKNLLGGQREAA